MTGENEFQQSEEISDLEFLKSFKPEWQNDRLEPLTPPPEDSVVPPTWQKVDLGNAIVQVGPGSNQSLQLVQVIAGKEEGGTFVPGLVNAIGPFVEL